MEIGAKQSLFVVCVARGDRFPGAPLRAGGETSLLLNGGAREDPDLVFPTSDL